MKLTWRPEWHNVQRDYQRICQDTAWALGLVKVRIAARHLSGTLSSTTSDLLVCVALGVDLVSVLLSPADESRNRLAKCS
jgi:hypothetical protein